MARRSVHRVAGAALAFVLSVGACVREARAADCERPDLIETIPGDGASGVPLNAQPLARYRTLAEYLDEEIAFTHVGVETVSLTGFFNAAEGILSVVPPTPLEAGARYQIKWPELRGLATASLGHGATVEFTAGSREDTKPPSFEGVTGLKWDVSRRRDECSDSVQDRFNFEIELGKASDDGGRDLLTLVVFQTAGPDIGADDPPRPVRVSKMPDGNTVHVKQAIDEAVGHVCFAAIVRDSTGLPSASGSKEVCVDTTAPPFFYGCSIVRRTSAPKSGLCLLFLLPALHLRRRKARKALPTA